MIIWKDIVGYEGLYQVSNTGLVRVLRRKRKSRHGIVLYPGRILSPAISKSGYCHVNLCKNNIQRSEYVHTLVAKHFVVGYSNGLEVNHKDCNKQNNNDWNLEWGTHQHNLLHAYNNGRIKSGINHPSHKLYNNKTNH